MEKVKIIKIIGEGLLAKKIVLQKQQGWDHYRNMAVYAIHAYNVCDGVLLTSKQFKTRSNALKFFDYCAKQKEALQNLGMNIYKLKKRRK